MSEIQPSIAQIISCNARLEARVRELEGERAQLLEWDEDMRESMEAYRDRLALAEEERDGLRVHVEHAKAYWADLVRTSAEKDAANERIATLEAENDTMKRQLQEVSDGELLHYGWVNKLADADQRIAILEARAEQAESSATVTEAGWQQSLRDLTGLQAAHSKLLANFETSQARVKELEQEVYWLKAGHTVKDTTIQHQADSRRVLSKQVTTLQGKLALALTETKGDE